jgi:hypothetical protein
MCVDADVASFGWQPSWLLRLAAFACASLRALALCSRPDLHLGTPWTLSYLQNILWYVETSWAQDPYWRGLPEVAFIRRWRLTPNSSPSKAWLNPDEPNLWLSVSSLLKASPPWVGVEAKLFAYVIVFCKKVCTRYRCITHRDGCVTILPGGLMVLRRCRLWGVLLFCNTHFLQE